MPTEKFSQMDIEDRLAELPGWSLDGDRITRTYRLGDHFAATALVVHIAQIQQELNHHSELTLGYNTVSLAVNTHDAGGAVTAKDFQLAERVERLSASHEALVFGTTTIESLHPSIAWRTGGIELGASPESEQSAWSATGSC